MSDVKCDLSFESSSYGKNEEVGTELIFVVSIVQVVSWQWSIVYMESKFCFFAWLTHIFCYSPKLLNKSILFCNRSFINNWQNRLSHWNYVIIYFEHLKICGLVRSICILSYKLVLTPKWQCLDGKFDFVFVYWLIPQKSFYILFEAFDKQSATKLCDT